jgi:translation initiation factor 5
MSLNIDREAIDPFYRYKMKPVQVKVEGRGNGIKTVLVNVEEIGRDLERSPEHITKFLSYVFGVQCVIDQRNGRYILNGSHERERVQEEIFAFVSLLVLCYECRNPETLLFCKSGRKSVYMRCRACGSEGQVASQSRIIKILQKELPDESEVKSEGRGMPDPFGGEGRSFGFN